jgi:hypothetical protein
MLHTEPAATILPEIAQPVSVGLNPLPETETVVPTVPTDGVRVIVGEVDPTVNVAWAESPLGLAETVMTYGPGVAVLLTVKCDAVNTPLEMLHTEPEPTIVPEIVQLVSPKLN